VLPALAYQGTEQALTPRQQGETQADALQRRLYGGAQVAGSFGGALEAPTTATERGIALKNKVVSGKQQNVLASAAKLPMSAVEGAEKVYRAAAPTGKNSGFRENVYQAAGDLAEIGRKLDLSEAQGGIVNPDLRVRATADAIREHMAEMYKNERAPQIQAIADKDITMHVSPDASEGLAYLKRAGGTDEIRMVAAKALEERVLTGAEADKLAMAANENLRGFERLTPAEKMQNQMTNRRLGSIKELDRTLGAKLDNALKEVGQPGIRGYERRYAALGEIERQLRDRMNAVELDVDKGKALRPITGILRGKAGIASASQAAVADVNIGRQLQQGLKQLGKSGINARR
jgi:hypothetical protein